MPHAAKTVGHEISTYLGFAPASFLPLLSAVAVTAAAVAAAGTAVEYMQTAMETAVAAAAAAVTAVAAAVGSDDRKEEGTDAYLCQDWGGSD